MTIRPKQEVQLSILPNHLERSDEALQRAEAERPMSHSPQICSDVEDARSADMVIVSTAAGRRKKGLIAAAVTGGTLLGGGLVAAVAVPLLKQQRDGALVLRDNAFDALKQCQANVSALAPSAEFESWLEDQIAPRPDDWSPSGGPETPSAPVSDLVLGSRSCSAPNLAQEPLFNNLTTNESSFYAAGPLFIGGLPRTGDIRRALSNTFAWGSTVVMESLAALQPQFLASNFRDAGFSINGTRQFAYRLFNRPTPLGAPTQGWVNVATTSDTAVDANAPVWPIVAVKARVAALQQTYNKDPLQAPGDQNDGADFDREAAMIISGSPVQSLPLNALARSFDLQFSYAGSQSAAFQDKDDNIPFVVEMLRTNPLLFGSVDFHMLYAPELFPDKNASITLPGGTLLSTMISGTSNNAFDITPVGKPGWTVAADKDSGDGYAATYAIVGMHADGLSLRSVMAAPDAQPNFLPYEAMTYAANKLNLGRIHCGERQLIVAA